MDDSDLEVPAFAAIDAEPFLHLPTPPIPHVVADSGQNTMVHHVMPQSPESYAASNTADLPLSVESESLAATTTQASHRITPTSISVSPTVTTATSAATTTLQSPASTPASSLPQATSKHPDTAVPDTKTGQLSSSAAIGTSPSAKTETRDATRAVDTTETSGNSAVSFERQDPKGDSKGHPYDRTATDMANAPDITLEPTRTTLPISASDATPSRSTSLSASEIVTSAPVAKAMSSTSIHSSTHSRSPSPSSATLGADAATQVQQVRAPTIQTVLPALNRKNETRQPAPQVVYTHASNPHPNESIYGTIMKRLLALEFNTTLTTSYMEEHTRTVWSAFRRIEEKIMNLEKTVSSSTLSERHWRTS